MSRISASEILSKAAGEESDLLPSVPSRSDDLVYDIGNLCAFDIQPLDKKELSQRHDEYLKETARDAVQLLVNRIYACPRVEVTNPDDAQVGPQADVGLGTTRLPREKPLPKQKPLTKWEQFRQEKGIKKTKRDRLVYDEATDSYKPRFGGKRARREGDQWLVEVKEGHSDEDDPFIQAKRAKKERVEKNRKQHLRNVEGPKAHAQDRITSLIGKQKYVPKSSIEDAFRKARVSTASMGKFDVSVEGEEETARRLRKGHRGKILLPSGGERRIAVDPRDEKKISMDVMERLIRKKRKEKGVVDEDRAVKLHNRSLQKKRRR